MPALAERAHLTEHEMATIEESGLDPAEFIFTEKRLPESGGSSAARITHKKKKPVEFKKRSGVGNKSLRPRTED